MIISHEHRYVFVQVPQTGCTAVGLELVDQYGAETALMKHTTLLEARLALGRHVSGYRVFASVRDPVDQVTSSYFKLRTDHHGELRGPEGGAERRRSRAGVVVGEDLDLQGYLDRFVSKRLFAPVWLRDQRAAELVLRFEQLAVDFETMLRAIGLTPTRPLPVRNETERPDVREPLRVPTALGPFMAEWGYGPAPAGVTMRQRLEYRAAPALRQARRLPRVRSLRRMAAAGRSHGD